MDKDLHSIQEARDLIAKAKAAQQEFKHFSQDQVDKIVLAMVNAGANAAEKLAKMAVEESQIGKYEDKITKNLFATKSLWESIKSLKTVGVIGTEANGKIIKIAEPMGVIATLIPCTNPTSTAMFKAIISVKTRNAIVASPHPRSIKCTAEALEILNKAAIQAGAPEGLINCMLTPTLEGTEQLMKHKDVALILATGGSNMVKAAYSSGKPAYGVGPGNVPAFIERSANVQKAVADIIYGKTFDNGTLCSSEQAIIADKPIVDEIKKEVIKNGGYFLNSEEKLKLEKFAVPHGHLNSEIVGKSAQWIAKQAGINIPENVKALVVETKSVGREEPLSIEKLSPILAFYVVDGWLEGCHKCIELLNLGGIGHTMAIHSSDKDIIMKFAFEKPAFRIIVNTTSALGAVGYTTALNPSLTLGPGTWGGSVISENVSAKHLMNIKHLAFETNPVNQGFAVDHIANSSEMRESFLEEIEKRLLARAGNPKVQSYQSFQKNEKTTETSKSISEEEIDKIIMSFFNKK
ncbi:MAG TPA: aldehyde dehydrogenase family protein [Ignavibacteriales bacterium]|nr:aldehyde dehydrogenase family protein [Ignavibacteriales bacterium]HOL80858.1 aldehyde dehydrogenase family protein [Ignavibacteriales bacterium]HOM65884.1 aldehyde dehydrogenase family protein [Ignavibacteriales bacterium]HPD67640.1 aldehyde dehydrogenase family protein [Ignavibacteriales bacterium]HPP33293.1 aldehyde dehydrogenase family protein [Ignavibacteriales bacterium]